jgi:chemotaxis protein CheD
MPTKYADLAVPYMLAMLVEREVSPLEIVAKVVGGASMFGENGMPRIGDENVEAVLRSLDETRIRTAGTHVGGTTGRRIELDCDTGILTVAMVGLPAVVLD